MKFCFTNVMMYFILMEKTRERAKQVEIMLYTIGIDGGGTKSEAVALSLDGEELGTAAGGASNAFAVGFERAAAAVGELLERLWRESGLDLAGCAAVGIGLAGVDRDEERRQWTEALTVLMRGCGAERAAVAVSNDAEIALYGTLGKRQGLVAISGTGSILYGIAADGRKQRVGGWGHLLGDAGSGYAIGLRTLQAVMDSYDGVRPPTLLTAKVLEQLRLTEPPQLKDYVYAPERTKQDIAAFARVCLEASRLGDTAAVRILGTEAIGLAEQTAALVRKDASFADGELVLAGSIFARSELFREAYAAELQRACPGVRPVPMIRSAAHGAAMLAAAAVRGE
jgi:N-acetylglucosamine kinase-like BadF-type ATPase